VTRGQGRPGRLCRPFPPRRPGPAPPFRRSHHAWRAARSSQATTSRVSSSTLRSCSAASGAKLAASSRPREVSTWPTEAGAASRGPRARPRRPACGPRPGRSPAPRVGAELVGQPAEAAVEQAVQALSGELGRLHQGDRGRVHPAASPTAWNPPEATTRTPTTAGESVTATSARRTSSSGRPSVRRSWASTWRPAARPSAAGPGPGGRQRRPGEQGDPLLGGDRLRWWASWTTGPRSTEASQPYPC
jgi:hypothetical protein